MKRDPAAVPLVVVTRDEARDGRLSVLLRDRGIRVLNWPTIATAPPLDPEPLRQAVAALDSFDWVAFTSRRAVAALALVLDAAAEIRPSIAVVGTSTAQEVRRRGWPIEVLPKEQTGPGLVRAMAAAGAGAGTRVLQPASDIALDEVREGLESLGADVVQVVAYRTVPARLDLEEVRAAAAEGSPDAFTFTSPSTVDNLIASLDDELRELARGTPAICIGPTTAEAARKAGFFRLFEADTHSLEGLADRVAKWAKETEEE